VIPFCSLFGITTTASRGMTLCLSVEGFLPVLTVDHMGFVVRDEGLLGAAIAGSLTSTLSLDVYKSFDEICAAPLAGNIGLS